MRIVDLIEPEETVGNLWHDWTQKKGESGFPLVAVRFEVIQQSIGILFRALGGNQGVDIGVDTGSLSRHRKSTQEKLGVGNARVFSAHFDGERLRLPPVIDKFPSEALNRTLYLWLTATAALVSDDEIMPFKDVKTVAENDLMQINLNANLTQRVREDCPGLWPIYKKLRQYVLEKRTTHPRNCAEKEVERIISQALLGQPVSTEKVPASKYYHSFTPVPLWVHFGRAHGGQAAEGEYAAESKDLNSAISSNLKKRGERKDQDQTNRRDSFIMHRFESILSWAESLNVNRHVDDDEQDNAQKAADDHEHLSLSKHDKKAAVKLRLHLDLSPADAEHEKLAGVFTYPEWNVKTSCYMEEHCRVLEATAPSTDFDMTKDERSARNAAKQFEQFRPRRLFTRRSLDGDTLDLDAAVNSRVNLMATGLGNVRIWQASRQIERDLSVVVLLDVSRSTEAFVGETSVLETARAAVWSFAHGVHSIGDRLGIWAFSSLKRNRVFLSRIKSFDEPMNAEVSGRIAGLSPGHYTRLGAAIRHVSAHLDKEPSMRKLIVVMTDGKPNDLDHYEGRHGIEDSRKAVTEARARGQNVFGIIVDEDGQDWFPRIFSRNGFSLVPRPNRLIRALPEIYKNLTLEE